MGRQNPRGWYSFLKTFCAYSCDGQDEKDRKIGKIDERVEIIEEKKTKDTTKR
jgi:hypothetical protein